MCTDVELTIPILTLCHAATIASKLTVFGDKNVFPCNKNYVPNPMSCEVVERLYPFACVLFNIQIHILDRAIHDLICRL